jgi:7-cyano-7-deazaguanine synthase in queuosine biosynthesis
MKIISALSDFDFTSTRADLGVVLYGQPGDPSRGSAGEAIKDSIRRRKLRPSPRAWDFLSIALSVVSADLAGHRNKSPDGWTRKFDLTVAVIDPHFWNGQAKTLEGLLGFLTTDRWNLHFIESGFLPAEPSESIVPDEDCVVLLSGGLDSFVGAVDLVAKGRSPLAVSQSDRGDAEKQVSLASAIGKGVPQLQLNHNASVPQKEEPPSQRARSIIFLAEGVLAATSLARYRAGERITLYMCENGFISINPPMTPSRIGSLSTRTSHPVVLGLLQELLKNANIKVDVENPYQFRTKGEMLEACLDQGLLKQLAHTTTSCGRFKRFNYRHCGRCVPCLIRRASFRKWGTKDNTTYVYKDLSRDDADYARFDDVRATAMAIAEVNSAGLDEWLGATLSAPLLRPNSDALRDVVRRGLGELEALLKAYKIR